MVIPFFTSAMCHQILLVALAAVFWTPGRSANFTEVVQTHLGPVRGEELTFEDTKYKSFKGIPYAAPPVENLRFKAPEPPQKWTELLDATRYGDSCLQPFYDPLPQMSEDCLTLNVFTQSLDKSNLKPVLVSIHISNFVFGDGTDDLYGPEYLIQEDIVVVTFNYRLGPLGFLSTNTSDASGNWGLKDQVAAFKWVQENIENFGGDPKQVTIYGILSGAASAHLHLFSPLSSDLFHKAILSTGSASSIWTLRTPDQAVRYSRNLARLLGASDSEIQDPAKRVEFLQSADGGMMVNKSLDVWDEEDHIPPQYTRQPFYPVIEAPTPGAFLIEDPNQMLKEGRFTKVPMMTGATNLHGVRFFGGAVNVSLDLMRNLENKCHFLPDGLREAVIAKNECPNVAEEIRGVYFDGKPSETSLLNLVNLVGDAFTLADLHYAQRMHAWFGSEESPIYNYYFTFDGKWNVFKMAKSLPGATHLDEIPYIFKISHAEFKIPDLPETSPEAITRNIMVRYIANFVKYGNPTPSVSDLIPIIWEPATEEESNTMIIGNELKLENEFLKARMEMWDRLYEKYARFTMFD